MTIGQDAADLRANGLAGTVAEVVDRLGRARRPGSPASTCRLLDLADLDQVELIAAEVAPQLADPGACGAHSCELFGAGASACVDARGMLRRRSS